MVVSASELLQTKLVIPPVRVGCVPRPRLTRQLDAGMRCPLTLICAPAGFGKTTLISDWCGQQAIPDFPVAWVSLEEDDNDPVRFLTYLVSALATMGDIDCDDIVSLLHSPQPPPPKAILTALIRRVETFPRPLALVLDDFHRITSPQLREASVFLLDHLPAQFHLIVTTREDPPFSLARLRGSGQLVEIRANDLRFTPEESAQFLDQMLGITLSADQVLELEVRTEGWIAGLQLAALAMKGRNDISSFIEAFTGSHRFILDYLTDEVLSRQPEEVQLFLLRTSILDRLSGTLCDAVTGENNGRAVLESVERNNLFLIPLDNDRSWYRYHHLFGDMLRRRLQHLFPDLVPNLHLRACAWLEQSNFIGEAVEHALLGKDWEWAALLVEQHGEKPWTSGEVPTLLRWLGALPEDVLHAHPKLGLKYAFTLMITDDFVHAEKRLQKVEQTLTAAQTDMDEFVRSKLLGQTIALHAIIHLQIGDDDDRTIATGHQALTVLDVSDVFWRGWTMMTIGMAQFHANHDMDETAKTFNEAIWLAEKANDRFTIWVALGHLSRIYLLQGKLRQAEANCQRYLQFAAATGWNSEPAASFERLDRSWLRYERNDLGGLYEEVLEGRQIIQDYYLKRITLPNLVMLARLKQLQGDTNAASELSRQIAGMRLRPAIISIPAWHAWLYLIQGDSSVVASWVQEIETTIYERLDPALEFEHITLARVQIAQGRLGDALQILTRLAIAAEAAGRYGRAIEIDVLQAVAAFGQGNIEPALDALQRALSRAESEGYVRVFVDEGMPMEELLREAQKRGIAPTYTAKLQAAFKPEVEAILLAPPQQRIGETIEALSERELEVLRLMADGDSNREIAEELFLSVGTVKKHLYNIFVKLNAHSRTQAIAAARQYNLL